MGIPSKEWVDLCNRLSNNGIAIHILDKNPQLLQSFRSYSNVHTHSVILGPWEAPARGIRTLNSWSVSAHLAEADLVMLNTKYQLQLLWGWSVRVLRPSVLAIYGYHDDAVEGRAQASIRRALYTLETLWLLAFLCS